MSGGWDSAPAPLGPFGRLRASIVTPVAVVATLLLALAIGFAPAAPGPSAPPAPHWLLLALAFWAQRRPSAVPPLLVFLAAALHEGLRDGPFGVELLALLVVTAGLAGSAERRPPVNFFAEWRRFAVAALGLEAAIWGLLAATYAPTPPLEALGLRLAASILVYPLAVIALERLTGQRRPENAFSHLGRGV